MPSALEQHARLAVTVRDLRGTDELRAAQELQRKAWGVTEDGYVVPVATMAAVQKVGGLVLGAFDAEDRLVGFAFGFLGRLQDRLLLYSQLTGVHPAHQSSGVGRLLKFEQRRRAAEMGLGAVVWAFDPLQAANAFFNLGVLGATCRTYEVDMYGSRSDALNAGLATDRLLAEWSTAGEPRPRTVAAPHAIDLVLTQSIEAQDLRQVTTVRDVPRQARQVLIEVPASVTDLKARGPASAAQDWQMALRQAFLSAFSMGFEAVGFSRAEPNRPRFLLERTR